MTLMVTQGHHKTVLFDLRCIASYYCCIVTPFTRYYSFYNVHNYPWRDL